MFYLSVSPRWLRKGFAKVSQIFGTTKFLFNFFTTFSFSHQNFIWFDLLGNRCFPKASAKVCVIFETSKFFSNNFSNKIQPSALISPHHPINQTITAYKNFYHIFRYLATPLTGRQISAGYLANLSVWFFFIYNNSSSPQIRSWAHILQTERDCSLMLAENILL